MPSPENSRATNSGGSWRDGQVIEKPACIVAGEGYPGVVGRADGWGIDQYQ